MRIVAGGASQFSGALQKTLRFAQSVARVRHFETRVLTALQIEREAEVRERLAGYVRERPAVEALERMRQRAAGGFEMALQADFHFAFGAQARGIDDRRANLLRMRALRLRGLRRAAGRVRGIAGNRFPVASAAIYCASAPAS